MTHQAAPRFAVVIPARYQSSRFPGKPLASLCGSTGIAKPLIQRSWETAVAACDASQVWVATDNSQIAEVVRSFGGQIIMTSGECRNGTERCAEAAEQIPQCPEILVNFQGDAPLTPATLISQLTAALTEDTSAAMATPALRCSPSTYDHLRADSAAGRVGGTTVVFDQHRRALYFSKRMLPYIPPETAFPADHVHLHLGIYAYRRAELVRYAAAAPSPLESLEGLEQLRFLAQGQVVKIVPLDPIGWDCIELNNPSDVEPLEAVLRQQGIE